MIDVDVNLHGIIFDPMLNTGTAAPNVARLVFLSPVPIVAIFLNVKLRE